MAVIRFGVEGWRARVDAGFDRHNVARIAQALGDTWSSHFPGSTVLVGFDTRRDSERLALLCGQVMAARGLAAVVSDRPCPLPALAWAAAHDPSCVGAVMLTASGKSHKYGGIVARQADGGPVNESFAEAVERRIAGRPTDARGTVERADIVSIYIDALVERMGASFAALPSARIVVDPMYGAGVGCACKLFERLGCEVIGLHDRAVSDFRGLHPAPREPWVDECERAVVESKACLGVVFDGDADRMGIIDERGRLISQHDLAPLALEHLVGERHDQDRVVATFETSVRLERQAEALGCAYTRVPGAFDAVYREFYEGDVLLGTDERGGICQPAHLKERDGLLAAGMVTAAILAAGGSPSGVVEELGRRIGRTDWGSRSIPLDPASLQRLHNLLPGMNPQEVAGREPVLLSHAGGLRITFEDGAWLMISTPSRLPSARVSAEASTAAELQELLAFGVDVVRLEGIV